METKHIAIAHYDYPLPDERIAKFPLPQRHDSKLLLYRQGTIAEDRFYNLAQYIPQDALLVFNNTKVIQARLHFCKATGAQIEVFCLEPYRPHDYLLSFQQTSTCSWLCIVGNLKKWKEGSLQRNINVRGKEITLTATRGEAVGTSHAVTFCWNNSAITFAELLEAVGELPIPPYLNRPTEARDKETYQTVYSKIHGSVAAPTAGLHFTPEVLAQLKARGIAMEELTLHVGAGTFKPVKSNEIGDHTMHAEYIEVHRSTIAQLIAHGGKAIAVGTTSVRTLESLYYIGLTLSQNPHDACPDLRVRQWTPYDTTLPKLTTLQALTHILHHMESHHLDVLQTETQIIIAPGYTYHIVQGMVTNFHQPKSTLLLLVSALVKGDWRAIYNYALAHEFRFLSYGDSSLLLP